MNRKISFGAALALALVLVSVSIPLTMLYARQEHNRIITDLPRRAEQFAAMEEIRDTVQRNYSGRVNNDVVNAEVVRGYIAGLGDPKSRYLDAAEYNSYDQRLRGESADLGLAASYDPMLGIVVDRVQSGSPAANSGLQKGDQIISVKADNQSVVNAADVDRDSAPQMLAELNKLRSIASDVAVTHITLTYLRDDAENTVNIMVGHNVPTVFGEIMQDDVGYLRISAFYKSTKDQLKSQMGELLSQGASTFIFDLRGCWDGTWEYACGALDLLVIAGAGNDVMATVNYQGRAPVLYAPSSKRDANLKTAVLTNAATDGPAELFAYNLRSYNSGKVFLFGLPTAGNNTLQEAFRLERVGGAVLLTVATVTPYGNDPDWCKGGVEPDFRYGNPDQQLSAALDFLKGNNEEAIVES
ncbi:MAG: S41 family peptidase [Oscillospiraceae bacterium]|nr:S41 family peptidase [Oscillospiraceae bacterium]